MVSVDNFEDDFLQTIGKEFGDYLKTAIEQRDRPVIISRRWKPISGIKVMKPSLILSRFSPPSKN